MNFSFAVRLRRLLRAKRLEFGDSPTPSRRLHLLELTLDGLFGVRIGCLAGSTFGAGTVAGRSAVAVGVGARRLVGGRTDTLQSGSKIRRLALDDVDVVALQRLAQRRDLRLDVR